MPQGLRSKGVRGFISLIALIMLTNAAYAASSAVMVSGKPDGATPGWTIATTAPAGWTQDCCQYASAIGVNLVLYQGDWSGKPDRVMVLNVWPSKLARLDDEWQEDRKHYLQRDPAAKIEPLPLHGAKLTCRGFLYHGSDQVDDAVVFCDPGKASGIRLSWSMAVAASDPTRTQVLSLLEQVVAASHYLPSSPAKH